MRQDVRAVENPISAMFDLSEDVASQAPIIRSLVRYAAAFIAVWLFVNAILGLVFLAEGAVFLLMVMLALFIIGMTSLVLLYRINRFFKYYVARQRAITAVRNMDPMVYAPSGGSPAERLVTYLRGAMPVLSGQEVEFAMPGIVQGQHGTQYRFDAYIKSPPGTLWRHFGVGRHGFAVYIKEFSEPPSARDMQALKKAVEDVSQRGKVPPVRVIALWERSEDQVLPEETYNLVNTTPVEFRHRFRRMTCSMEIVSETAGSYDFIPYMSQ